MSKFPFYEYHLMRLPCKKVHATQEGIGVIESNSQVNTTQEGMQEIKNNPQVYTS